MIRRNLIHPLLEALGDTPVVTIIGARRTGKTTLVREVAESLPGARYRSLDDAATLAAAVTDPVAFVRGGSGTLVIDEVQKAPELLPAIKVEVDTGRRPGRFLLTGSAHPLVVPKVSESLAGRMEILTLRPFSQGELEGRRDAFVDAVFGDQLDEDLLAGSPEADVPALIASGQLPEVRARSRQRRKDAWFSSYVTAILQRDVRDLAAIEGLTRMPHLLGLLASRTAQLLNKAELSRSTGIAYTTLDRYLALLEATFLLEPLPAWAGNRSKRLVRSPKVFLVDSGLAAHLVGAVGDRMAGDPALRGTLVESFVVSELRKQASWADLDISLWHYRSGRRKVDVVLEDRAGRVVGIEVKAGATLGRGDVAGLLDLARAAGDRFLRGVILYGGREVLSFGPNVMALPIGALWHG